MAQPQADADIGDPVLPPEVRKTFKELSQELEEIRPPLIRELHRIVLRPIIWNTLANLELCILNKSFGTVLKVLETQILTTADEKQRKVLRELRKKATAYLKSKPENKAKKLQYIEETFVKSLKEIPLLHEWQMNFNDWSPKAQSEQAQHVEVEQAQQAQVKQQQAQENATNLLGTVGIESLKKWRVNPQIEQVNRLMQEKTTLSSRLRISTSKTRLENVKAHPLLHVMLTNINLFKPFLEVILEKYEAIGLEISAVNEHIQKELNTPLHYAVQRLVETLDQTFIKWLLVQEDIDVNCRNRNQVTPLELIVIQYVSIKRQIKFNCDINSQQLDGLAMRLSVCKKFIQRLVEKGANLEPTFKQRLWEAKLIKKDYDGKDEEIVKKLRSIQDDEDELLATLLDSLAESESGRQTEWELLDLKSILRREDQTKFKQNLATLTVNVISGSFVKNLIIFCLHTAVELNLTESIVLLVEKYGQHIFSISKLSPATKLVHRVELKGLLRKACDNANPDILKLLLTKIDRDESRINDDPILLITLKDYVTLDVKSERKDKLFQCAKILAGDQRIFIAKTDPDANTALHIAIKYGLDDIAMTICTERRHACLGAVNSKGETPLDYVQHAFLEQYLDNTVQTYKSDLILNMNGFSPYYSKKFLQNVTKNPPGLKSRSRTLRSSIQCIMQISNSKKLKPLLNHPVIKTYVQIVWLKWNILHILNLLFTFLTSVFFISYTLEYFCHGNFSIMLSALSGFGWLYVVVRELFQWTVFGNNYFTQCDNWCDIVNIVVMLGVLVFSVFLDSNTIQYLTLPASLSVIIFAYEIIYLAGALSDDVFSTYRWMLLVVAKNFCLSILVFCPILLAFYYSFYLNYNSHPISNSSVGSERDNNSDTFNTFGTGVGAGVKILVMSTGEFEAAAMHIEPIKVFIFMLFILCVPMIIQNLINGLAVSDINAIREESELINLRNKAHLLARIESGLKRKSTSTSFNYLCSKLINPILEYLQGKSEAVFYKNSPFIKITMVNNNCAKIMVEPRTPWNVSNTAQDAINRQPEPEAEKLLSDQRNNQDFAIPMPDENGKSSQDSWVSVKRFPLPNHLQRTFKWLPQEATLDKTVLVNLQRIADRNQIKMTRQGKEGYRN